MRDLIAGQQDLVCRAGLAGVLEGGGDGEDGSGEHGEGDHRCQDVQRRTWCSSRPVRPLPAWKFSSTVQRSPAVLTRAASVTGWGL